MSAAVLSSWRSTRRTSRCRARGPWRTPSGCRRRAPPDWRRASCCTPRICPGRWRNSPLPPQAGPLVERQRVVAEDDADLVAVRVEDLLDRVLAALAEGTLVVRELDDRDRRLGAAAALGSSRGRDLDGRRLQLVDGFVLRLELLDERERAALRLLAPSGTRGSAASPARASGPGGLPCSRRRPSGSRRRSRPAPWPSTSSFSSCSGEILRAVASSLKSSSATASSSPSRMISYFCASTSISFGLTRASMSARVNVFVTDGREHVVGGGAPGADAIIRLARSTLPATNTPRMPSSLGIPLGGKPRGVVVTSPGGRPAPDRASRRRRTRRRPPLEYRARCGSRARREA